MTPFYERDGITLYVGDCLDVVPMLVERVIHPRGDDRRVLRRQLDADRRDAELRARDKRRAGAGERVQNYGLALYSS